MDARQSRAKGCYWYPSLFSYQYLLGCCYLLATQAYLCLTTWLYLVKHSDLGGAKCDKSIVVQVGWLPCLIRGWVNI